MKREEQKIENTWNTKLIYSNDEIFEKELKKTENLFENLLILKNDYLENEEKFYLFLEELFLFEQNFEKLYAYVHHNLDTDLKNNKHQKNNNKISNKASYFSEKLSFLTSSIIENEGAIKKYLEVKKGNIYRKYFDNIFKNKKYTLNKNEEKILALTGEINSIPYRAYSALTDSEMIFSSLFDENNNELKLTNSNFFSYLISNNREVRKEAFINIYQEYKKSNITLSMLLVGQIQTNIFKTKTRGYSSTIFHSLYSNNINEKVYNNLITVIHQKIKLNHKYISMRKNILKVDELYMYDMYVPLVKQQKKEYSYENSKQIIYDSLKVLGSEYNNILNQAFNNRWIDIYPNDNKRSGAYSGGAYGTAPYILLNYTNTMNDMYTLIHELGHSVHTYFANENNNYHDSHYTIFIAEIASTVNELLLTKYLLGNTDKKEDKIIILNYLLEQFRTTVIRQTMFAEFEKEIHASVESEGNLTAEELNDKYYNLQKFYFGNDINLNDEIKYEWSRIPHFYYNFYVYQYATSFCAAVKISNEIYAGNQEFIGKYIDFLKLGNSKYPLDALKTLDIDLNEQDVLLEAMDEYEKTLKIFEENIEEYTCV